MADISQWSSDERENVKLDDLNLSNEQGLLWNKIMSAVRKWFDYTDHRVRRLEGAYVHKGTVETYADLPATGQQIGDVYTVSALGGENYVWTETGWRGLGNVNANLVHKDTDETIDGEKTFLQPIVGSVTGSAGSVDAFSTAHAVTLNGDVTGSASSTAGWTVPTSLVATGVTAGTYGPDADKSPAAEASFVVPCFTVDAKGRVTAVVERTITLPADSDTTYSAFQGATSLADGATGLVPKPLQADVDKVLGASGAWRLLTASDIASGTLSLDRIPTMDAAHIPALDASKIASGTIDIARLPAAAIERLVIVRDQVARYALTDQDVQLGDTVKERVSGLMFFVVDTDSLDSAEGYEPYTVGAAASVPWSGVTGKPVVFPPESHVHGKITSGGALSTASRAVVTDSTGLVDVSSVTVAELSHLSGVTSNVQTQLNGKADSSAIPAIPNLSRTISGSGNAITDITVSGHAITATKGSTFLTSHQSLTDYAKLASPAFTGTPTAPTAATSTNNTQIATTAFVKAQGYITSSGSITGSAAKLGTSTIGTSVQPIYLDAGTATAVSSALKSCYAVVESEAVTNNIFKIASGSMGSAYNGLNLVILIQNIMGGNAAVWRISLNAGSTTGVYSAGTSVLVDNIGLDPANFIVAYKSNSGGNLDFELYTKIVARYSGYRFTVIQECWRVSQKLGNILTLYNQLTSTGTAAITSGYTALTTSKASVNMDISGNAATVSGTAGTSLLAWDTENTVYTVGGHAIKVKLPANPNTDTHWTSHLYAGASNGNTNAATTNGNTYLIICDNTTARDRRLIKGTGATTVTSDSSGNITINSTDNNTTYSANNGVGLSGTTFYNSGVRSIATGSTNGTISVNTNGTAANVAVKGLGSAAYTASTAYAAASHTHSYLPLSGGSMTGTITTSASTPLKLNNASVTTGTQPSSTQQTFYISINEKNGSNYLQQFGGMLNKNGSSYIRFYAKPNIANATGYILEWIATSSNCMLQPQTNNIALLGTSTNRWEQIWCHQSSINSASDARMKSGIAGIPDEVLDAWAGINWVQFQFNESIAEKGAEKARLHTGLIAQDVDAAFKELGLDVSRYGLFLHDSWDAEPEEVDNSGKTVKPAREAGDAFGLRYVEALCVEAAYQRRRADRLEERIVALEERLNGNG